MISTSVTRFQLVLLLSLCTLLLSTSSVLAHSIPNVAGEITEYPIPTPESGAIGITSGPDGNLWFAEHYGNKIGDITLKGKISEYPAESFPVEITSGPDGNLWYTGDAQTTNNNIFYGCIAKLLLTGKSLYSYLPSIASRGVSQQVLMATSGSQKTILLSDWADNSQPACLTEFPVPTYYSEPSEITTGPDGNLWFTEVIGNKIGKITPSGHFTEFAIPTVDSSPIGIAPGPDGNLWFTEYSWEQDRAHHHQWANH